MTKQYLKPGMTFTFTGGPATVGLSCSVVDLTFEWSGCEEYTGDEGLGRIVMGKWTFYVFRDEDGRLFYDDEDGV